MITADDEAELRAFVARWPSLANMDPDEIHSIWVDQADQPLRIRASVISHILVRLDEAEKLAAWVGHWSVSSVRRKADRDLQRALDDYHDAIQQANG